MAQIFGQGPAPQRRRHRQRERAGAADRRRQAGPFGRLGDSPADAAGGRPGPRGRYWHRRRAAAGARSIFFNVGGDLPDAVAPYQPWAKALMEKRRADNSKDNPDALCLPMGIMQMTSHPYPRKIIQTPKEVLVIYEGSGTTVRELFMDGRALPPKDVEPWWNGYTVARWEGDTLVAETTGLMDDGWLDVQGSPITNAGRLIERFRRPNYGTLQIEVTIDDPKAYTRPFTATVNYRLSTDTQLIEFVCIEKSGAHYVGADGKPAPTK